MKGIRMLGLSNTVLVMLTKLRELEVDAHKYIRKIQVWVLLVSNVVFQLTTLSTYVTFAIIMLMKHNGTGLDFNTLYGSLSALKLVTSPLMMVIQLIPAIQTSLASLERIEMFLKDKFLENVETSNVYSTPSSDLELHQVEANRAHAPLISMQNATFAVDDQILLRDVTTSFRPESFTMIIGKVRNSRVQTAS
jgi:ATP-binding cassette subfamily C (CFTR/MRP) protein 1